MKNIKLYTLVILFLGAFFSSQVNAQCTANFSAVSNSNGSVSFTNTSVGNSQYTFYYWSFGDGTSSYATNPTHQYNTNGYALVCLTAYDSLSNCQTSYCDSVLISGASGITCSVGIGNQVSGLTVSLYAAQPTSNITSYSWWFGNGATSSSSNPTYTYANAGTYTVYLVAVFANGCVDTVYSTITIANAPVCNAQYSFTMGANGLVTFVNQSTPAQNGFVMYYWNFGDGTTGYNLPAPVAHSYTSNGTYQACLTVIDSLTGCSDTYCSTISITNINSVFCNANFTVYDSLGYFYFIPTGNASTYTWNFGDGTTSTQAFPVHQYANYGTYGPCLTVQMNGATCTSCDTVNFYGTSPCAASFNSYVDTSGSGMVYFNNQSIGNFQFVYWSFGDGTSSSLLNPVHTFTQQGTYTVCLTVYNNSGCQSSTCDTIIIGNPVGPCTPVFFSYPDSTIGNGVVNFGLINNCANQGWTYTWNFGDTTTSTGLYQTHVYQTSGWFWVCVDAVDPNGNVLTWCDSVNSNRVGSVGLNEISKNAIIAFPNPANDQVTIKNIGANQSVEIYSVEGKLIYTAISTTVDVVLNTATWNTGLYIVRINEGNYNKVGKISVQH